MKTSVIDARDLLSPPVECQECGETTRPDAGGYSRLKSEEAYAACRGRLRNHCEMFLLAR